jgi:hypothetical protein
MEGFYDKWNRDELLTVGNRALANAVRTSGGYAAPQNRDDELSLGEDRFFSRSEAANFVRVSTSTVDSWLWKKWLPRYKASHRTLILKSDLIRFIVAGGKSPGPKRKAAPAPDAAADALRETAELPEPSEAAAPQAPPRRLYRRQKATPAQTA